MIYLIELWHMTSSDSPSPVRRQPLTDQVLKYLEQQIATNVYPVGSRLPAEPDLMRQLGIGRSTLREAIRVLAHSGVVEVRPGDGTYVCKTSADQESLDQRLRHARVLEVYEVRRALELECAALAASRRDEADIARLYQALQTREAALTSTPTTIFLDADLAFHTAVAEATKNTLFAELYRTFLAAIREALQATSQIPDLISQNHHLHVSLVEAIVQQDPQRARQIAESLLDTNTRHLYEIIQEDEQKANY
jgi:GntR family transcriptional repressor for pyruvate dehydrogenase complex